MQSIKRCSSGTIATICSKEDDDKRFTKWSAHVILVFIHFASREVSVDLARVPSLNRAFTAPTHKEGM